MQQLNIQNHAITTTDGLYSLNDLHKASGGEHKHQPSRFIRLDQTKALINEIECYPDMGITPVRVAKGNHADGTKQGTYVCRELVYAYAMWISPKFHLHVIRAFDQAAVPAPDLKDMRFMLYTNRFGQLDAKVIQPEEQLIDSVAYCDAMNTYMQANKRLQEIYVHYANRWNLLPETKGQIPLGYRGER